MTKPSQEPLGKAFQGAANSFLFQRLRYQIIACLMPEGGPCAAPEAGSSHSKQVQRCG